MRETSLYIENAHFMPWPTNFAGNPKKDKYGSNERKGSLKIPDIDIARKLIDEGFNVKLSKPKSEDDAPEYHIPIILSYRYRTGEPVKYPPRVIFIEGNGFARELDEDSASRIDSAWIDHVNVVLNKYTGERGKSLYVKTMEVFEKTDDDPILARYRATKEEYHDETDDVNFNPQNDSESFLL